MSKKKRRPTQRRPIRPLEKALAQAERLVSTGRAHEAVALLEPLLKHHPQHAELRHYLGYASYHTGQLTEAIGYLQEATQADTARPEWLLLLGAIYNQVGCAWHCERTAEQVIRRFPDFSPEPHLNLRQAIASSQAERTERAATLGLSQQAMDRSTELLEMGRLAMMRGEFETAVQLYQQTIDLAPGWATAHNDQALVLFFMGQHAQAIQIEEQVLRDIAPDSLFALGNLVRFHVMLGHMESARVSFERLMSLKPRPDVPFEYQKMTEACAWLEEDQPLYDLLKEAEAHNMLFDSQLIFFLGVAAANLGHAQEAEHYWRQVEGILYLRERARTYRRLLEQGRPGPGYASRFPYYGSLEYLPSPVLEKMLSGIGRGWDAEEKARRLLKDLSERYPQLVQVATKLIWELDSIAPHMV